jgi:hypothetical protein
MDGYVYRVSDPFAGNVMYLKHTTGPDYGSNRFTSVFYHLESYTKASGAYVKQGEQIAWSGHTGQGPNGESLGAHLHFAIHVGGTGWYDGTAYRPEPLSGYSGFGAYGYNTKYHAGSCATFTASPVYYSMPPSHFLTPATNTNGLTQIVTIASYSGTVYYSTEGNSPSASWSPWIDVGLAAVNFGRIAAATDAAGKIELFGRGPDGTIYVNKQANPNCGGLAACFPSWVAFTGTLASDAVVIPDVYGNLEVFAVGFDQQLWNKHQLSSELWSAWLPLGGRIEGSVSVAINWGGTLEVFVRAYSSTVSDDVCYHLWQDSVGDNQTWEPAWQQLGTFDISSDPVAAYTQDGTLDVFATHGNDNHVIETRQTGHDTHTSYGGWWNTMGGGPMAIKGGPTVAMASDGYLEVMGMSSSSLVIHIYQLAGVNQWSGPYTVSGTRTTVPVISRDPYYTPQNMEIFAYGSDQIQGRSYQLAPHNHVNYSAWMHVVLP